MNIIKSIITKIKLSKYKKKFNFNYDKSTLFGSSFKIRGRNGATVNIGKDCLLYGVITCEQPNAVINIGERSFLNKNVRLISINNIDIGNDVSIAWDVTIFDHNAHSFDWKERRNDSMIARKRFLNKKLSIEKNWAAIKSAPIKICDKAWIGFGVTILKGVTIGEGAIVGANSVVKEDVEPYTVVFGNPAVKIGDVRRD